MKVEDEKKLAEEREQKHEARLRARRREEPPARGPVRDDRAEQRPWRPGLR